MNTEDIRNIVKSTLAAANVIPNIVFPNVNNPTPGVPLSPPYAILYFFNTRKQLSALHRTTLAGDAVVEYGSVSITVVGSLNVGENQTLAYADDIAAVFTAGTRLSFTGGVLTVLAPPSIVAPFESENTWRVPVLLDYVAAPTTA